MSSLSAASVSVFLGGGNLFAVSPREAGQTSEALVLESDAKDIRASLQGDGDAYARLVKRYENKVAAQLWRFTRDAGKLEELVQQVFVEGYLSLAGFKGRAPFEHWIRRITTRVGYRHWTTESKQNERQATLTQWKQSVFWMPQKHEPSEAAEYLYELLAALPPKDRLVLTLLYFEGCTTEEIAKRMGWSRSLVKVRAFRVRKKLRQQLEEAGYGKAKQD